MDNIINNHGNKLGFGNTSKQEQKRTKPKHKETNILVTGTLQSIINALYIKASYKV